MVETAARAGAGTEFDKKSFKLKRQREQLAHFLKETGLKQERGKEWEFRFDRSLSAKSVAGAKRELTRIENRAIINAERAAGKIKLQINHEKQARHFKDSPEYIKGKSYLTITEREVAEIIKERYGTGKLLYTESGEWKKTEKIECGRIIGVNISQYTGEETPTTKAKIHYSKTGTHLVPRKDTKND